MINLLKSANVNVPAVKTVSEYGYCAQPEDHLYSAMKSVVPSRIRGAPVAKATTTPTPVFPND